MLKGVQYGKGCSMVRGCSVACLRVVQWQHPQRPLLCRVTLKALP